MAINPAEFDRVGGAEKFVLLVQPLTGDRTIHKPSTESESFGDIGRKYDIGVYDMIEANPNVDPWSPRAGAKLIVPTKFILSVIHREKITFKSYKRFGNYY